MLPFLSSIKSLIKVDNIHTDNNVFKLHYRFTVTMLIVFSILVTGKQYFGEPIICDSDVVSDRKKVIDTYCWISGTFTNKKTLSDTKLPGLGNGPPVDYISHKYYQWVYIVFCLQALLFYAPRYLWKTWEGGRLRLLVKDFGGPLISPSWNKDDRERLVTYMLAGRYSHNFYCIRFVICEILNFGNVVTQILLMDWFLFNEFSGYGIAVLTFTDADPMARVFPKVAKCTYHKYGPSGSPETRDALCILPMNVVNEKLFIFIWFWFYLLAILSAFALIYRSLILLFPRLRVYLLMTQIRRISQINAEAIIKRLSFGDYFVLNQLGKNLNPLIYKDLMSGIENTLNGKSSLSYNIYNPENTNLV